MLGLVGVWEELQGDQTRPLLLRLVVVVLRESLVVQQGPARQSQVAKLVDQAVLARLQLSDRRSGSGHCEGRRGIDRLYRGLQRRSITDSAGRARALDQSDLYSLSNQEP